MAHSLKLQKKCDVRSEGLTRETRVIHSQSAHAVLVRRRGAPRIPLGGGSSLYRTGRTETQCSGTFAETPRHKKYVHMLLL